MELDSAYFYQDPLEQLSVGNWSNEAAPVRRERIRQAPRVEDLQVAEDNGGRQWANLPVSERNEVMSGWHKATEDITG
jgi:hypothetical protein